MRVPFHSTLSAGSFNGVPFQTDSNTTERGKRVEVHEYPFRDTPYIEEYGRRALNFKINANLIGDDCLLQRDKLLAELEKAGEGRLIHPYYGSVLVTVGEISVSENWDKGRRVDIAFTAHIGDLEYPSATVSNAIVDKADKANAAIEKSFTEKFKTFKMPDYVGAKALDDFNKAIYYANKAISIAGKNSAGLFDEFKGNLPNILGDGGRVAQGWLSAIGGISGMTKNQSAQRMVASVKNVSLPIMTGINYDIVNQNTKAIELMLKQTVAVQAAISVKDDIYFNDLKSSADAVRKMFDGLCVEATDDEFEAFQDLIVGITSDIAPLLKDSAREIKLDYKDSKPAIFIAYNRFKDMTRETEIIERNKVKHPLFVDGEAMVRTI